MRRAMLSAERVQGRGPKPRLSSMTQTLSRRAIRPNDAREWYVTIRGEYLWPLNHEVTSRIVGGSYVPLDAPRTGAPPNT